MLNNKEDLGDSVGVEDEKKVHTVPRYTLFLNYANPMPTFLKVSFACSVQCNQIFGPRKARILVKKQEKMRQPKMSHFLAREQPPKSATFARNHEILSHWLRI